MLEVDGLMASLSERRQLFHSEADFQHALAWRIHETVPDCEIRLEFNPFPDPAKRRRTYIDIWLPTEEVAVELKYLTRKLNSERHGERYYLSDQGAQDQKRYDFLKDIQRLETVVSERKAKAGFAILLTNDQGYWNVGQPNTYDTAFRIHEGRRISGVLAWSENAKPGTTKDRETPISLNGTYSCSWTDYSHLEGESYGRFRYLAISVQSQ